MPVFFSLYRMVQLHGILCAYIVDRFLFVIFCTDFLHYTHRLYCKMGIRERLRMCSLLMDNEYAWAIYIFTIFLDVYIYIILSIYHQVLIITLISLCYHHHPNPYSSIYIIHLLRHSFKENNLHFKFPIHRLIKKIQTISAF